jgi:hypothetical protein
VRSGIVMDRHSQVQPPLQGRPADGRFTGV